MATTKTETTRGHWLEHHEHSSSSATLTKMDTARGPTRAAIAVIASYWNANLTHSCCDVHECMFQECHNFCAHCPVTFWWQSMIHVNATAPCMSCMHMHMHFTQACPPIPCVPLVSSLLNSICPLRFNCAEAHPGGEVGGGSHAIYSLQNIFPVP